MMRRLCQLLTAAALFASMGCGLSDYESRMDAQSARIKLFDTESALLGDAIKQPMYPRKTDKGTVEVPFWPFDVFLRLPRGVPNVVGKDGQFSEQNLSLFRFGPGNDFSVFIAAGKIAEVNKENKYKEGEWPIEYFRGYVHDALKAYYAKEYRAPNIEFPSFLKLPSQKRQPMNEKGELLPALDFDSIAFSDAHNKQAKDHSLFQVFFHQNAGRQAVVIYQCPLSRASDERTVSTIDWSIKSLDIGPYSLNKFNDLQKRNSFRR